MENFVLLFVQAQYVFIHDALNELITCGQTDVVASALRTKVNFLSKIIPAKGITGFQNQFQVWEWETWNLTAPFSLCVSEHEYRIAMYMNTQHCVPSTFHSLCVWL